MFQTMVASVIHGNKGLNFTAAIKRRVGPLVYK
uniref:Uncharacterized protein n=1 Tax=Anguilla anguilla TaxID=7936 RepID=A0A0E9R2M4_ANGAN